MHLRLGPPSTMRSRISLWDSAPWRSLWAALASPCHGLSVLERRQEIGLRRDLGATKRHIWGQFLTESLILAAVGGLVGVVLGSAVTVAYAGIQEWDAVVPLYGLVGGIGAALAIGAVAGLYPAVRAARLAPTEALRSV